MKNIYYLSLLGIFLFSSGCQKEFSQKDPIQNLNLGIAGLEESRQVLMNRQIGSEPNEDSTSYRYFIQVGENQLPVVLDLNPDGYYFGKLREVRLGLGGDTILFYSEPTYYRGNGPRKKDEVDKILLTYKNWFGKPDSIVDHMSNPLLLIVPSADNVPKLIAKTFLWKRKDHLIKFYLPNPTFNFKRDSVYEGAEIYYEMINYDKEFKKIQDSIRSTYVPNDVLDIRLNNPEWLTSSEKRKALTVEMQGFYLKAREVTEGINAVRFDIVIVDIFEKPLCRIKDVTYEFKDKKLQPPEGGLVFSFSKPTIMREYSAHEEDYTLFKRAEDYAKSYRVKSVADITSIRFVGGGILESNR